MNKDDKLIEKMLAHNTGDPKRSLHFLKVHALAKLIGQLEGLDEKLLRTLEVAAITHDIGIKPSESKYGSAAGNLQEVEGPPLARQMLEEMDYEQELVDRVCYLIGRHHTYTNMDGLDYQILVEADFMVNMFESAMSEEARNAAYKNIFKSKTGRKLYRQMYGLTGQQG